MATSVLDLILRSRKQGDAARKTNKDLKETERQSRKTRRGLSKMGKAAKVAAVAGLAVLSAAVGKFIKGAIETASAVEEMENKFRVVFGEEAPRATEELDRFADRVNRSTFDLMEMASTLQDTFVPLGFTRKAAADLSVEMTKLATDVASFNNASDTDVIRDFQSAIVGNHETVRKYGIIITEATLKQEAYESGIAALGSELSNAEKVQARLNLITEGTADAHGDAAETATSFENASKGLAASIKDLEVVVGEGLIPGMKTGVRVATRLADGLVAVGESSEMLQNAMTDSAKGAIEAGQSFEEWRDAILDNSTATEKFFLGLTGLNKAEFEAIRAALAHQGALDALTESQFEQTEATRRARIAQHGYKIEVQGTDRALRRVPGRVTSVLVAETENAREGIQEILDMLSGLQRQFEIRAGVNVTGPEPTDPTGRGTGSGGGGGGQSASDVLEQRLDAGGQHGLDMRVPPGFPNDSFRVGATSGERVVVQTPQQEAQGQTAQGRAAPGGPMIGTQIVQLGSELEGRAFLQKMNRSLERWA